MWKREQWRAFFDLPVVEWTMFVVGILLLAISLVVGTLPGPGGIFFALPGLILVLKSSMWARRHYVKFKRWQPRAGRWADWALQRRSAKRRDALAKASQPDENATMKKTHIASQLLDRLLGR